MNAHALLGVAPTASKAEIREEYRKLARRWHPDRFAEGPERDWANERMAEINAAYRSCMRRTPSSMDAEEETRTLRRIEELIDGDQLSLARRMLMSIATRSAEWNYLFGEMLIKSRDVRKACIYLGVAAHQKPTEPKYAKALREVQRMSKSAQGTLLSRIFRIR